MLPSRRHTNALGDLLCLCSAGRNTALGYANAVLKPVSACHVPHIFNVVVFRTDSSSAADLYSWIESHLRCWSAERFTGACCYVLAFALICASCSVGGFLLIAETWWDIRRL
jgi:hypothetical protein